MKEHVGKSVCGAAQGLPALPWGWGTQGAVPRCRGWSVDRRRVAEQGCCLTWELTKTPCAGAGCAGARRGAHAGVRGAHGGVQGCAVPEAVAQQVALKRSCAHGARYVLRLCLPVKWRGQVGWKKRC